MIVVVNVFGHMMVCVNMLVMMQVRMHGSKNLSFVVFWIEFFLIRLVTIMLKMVMVIILMFVNMVAWVVMMVTVTVILMNTVGFSILMCKHFQCSIKSVGE